VGWGAPECCSFPLNSFAINEVWKLQMNVRVSELQIGDQISVRERVQRTVRAETEVQQLIQSILNDETGA